MVREAASNGAQVVSLPECFNSPYGTRYFPEYCEPVPDGDSTRTLSELAKETKTYLIGGESHYYYNVPNSLSYISHSFIVSQGVYLKSIKTRFTTRALFLVLMGINLHCIER